MAIMFGYKIMHGIVYPVRWDSEVPQAIIQTYQQERELSQYDIHRSLNSLEMKYSYKPPSEDV